ASAWAVGTRGLVFRSDDYGASWVRQTPGYSASVTRLSFPSASRGYAVGELGGIFVTDDGGRSWRVAQGQYDAYAFSDVTRGTLGNTFRGVHFISDDEGWVVGDPVV